MKGRIRIMIVFAVILFLVVFFLQYSGKKAALGSVCSQETHREFDPDAQAWVSIVYDPSYIRGSLILGYSLKRTSTVHQTILLVPSNLTLVYQPYCELMQKVWDKVIIVDPMDYKFQGPPPPDDVINRFIKVRTHKLIETSRFGFISSDHVVLENIDELIDCPSPCAGFSTKHWATNSIGPIVTSDFMILERSLDDYDKLLDLIAEIPTSEMADLRDEAGRVIGLWDQGVFGIFYGPFVTSLSYTRSGPEVTSMITDRYWAWDLEGGYSVLNFYGSSPKPWEVGNPSQVFKWEKVIYREPFEVYFKIMKEYQNSLNENEQKLFLNMGPLVNEFSCAQCDGSKALRDSGADSAAFEAQFFIDTWQKHLDFFNGLLGKDVPATKFACSERIALCQKKIDYYKHQLEKLKA